MKKTLTILLLLVCGSIAAQPQVFLGSSKPAIRKYMKYQPLWKLSAETGDRLIYTRDDTTITYSFVKSRNGLVYFCNRCIVSLPIADKADNYIASRVSEMRFRPADDGLRWTLVTDLSEHTIHIIRVGNNIIYKY